MWLHQHQPPTNTNHHHSTRLVGAECKGGLKPVDGGGGAEWWTHILVHTLVHAHIGGLHSAHCPPPSSVDGASAGARIKHTHTTSSSPGSRLWYLTLGIWWLYHTIRQSEASLFNLKDCLEGIYWVSNVYTHQCWESWGAAESGRNFGPAPTSCGTHRWPHIAVRLLAACLCLDSRACLCLDAWLPIVYLRG